MKPTRGDRPSPETVAGRTPTLAFLCATLCAAALLGCATTRVGPTSILQAPQEIPEDQLLDVGIVVFTTEEMTPAAAQEQGTTPDIRKAERHFMAYHLKNTLQQSGHWGAVRVVPAQTDSVDLLVQGTIAASDGQALEVTVEARDAGGRQWLKKTYAAEATSASYSATVMGERDAFQDVYNRIANDLAEIRMALTPEMARNIRMVSQLRFAAGFAPEPYAEYLKKAGDGTVAVNRLPAENDPMMGRLLRIREREHMFVDALNQQYEGFYARMWPSYNDWRRSSLEERLAREKIERDALVRQVAGALLLAGAVALGAKRGEIGLPEVAMVVIGGQVIVNGYNLSKQAQIHSDAIKELSETFGSEMRPIVVEFEGRQYELTGPAEEQFKRWRELLREIYQTETGFGDSAPKPAGP
jgi:hypothetical protein